MADQDEDSDSALTAFGKGVASGVANTAKSAARGAQVMGRAAFGLARLPGEDDDEYARRYNTD